MPPILHQDQMSAILQEDQEPTISKEDREFHACVKKAIEIFNSKLTKKKSKTIEVGDAETDEFWSLEELKTVTQEAHKKCFGARNSTSERLGRCCVVLDTHAHIIDVMIQQQPFFVNIIWGGIRFIVKALACEIKAGPEIAAGLEDVLRRIPQLRIELRNYPDNDSVADATSAVLARIICFLVNAKHFVQKPCLSRALSSTSNKLSGILRDVALLDEARARVIGSFSLKEASSEKAKQTNFRDTQREFSARTDSNLAKLSGEVQALPAMFRGLLPNYSETIVREWLLRGVTDADIPAISEPSTCCWVFDSPEYKEWVGSEFKNCFCIEGASGCGKSTLASWLINHMPNGTITLKIFFGSSRRRHSFPATASFAATLLAALLRNSTVKRDTRFPDIFQHILRLSEESETGIQCPALLLLAALDKVIALVTNFVLVVDALDECANTRNCEPTDYFRLLDYLRKLISLPKARVILLAQPGVFQEKTFEGAPWIFMNPDRVRGDLTCFVEQEIERNKERKLNIWKRKEEIVAQVVEKCQGNFHWANLIMRGLFTAANSNEIDRRLAAFPTTFTKRYLKELEDVDVTLCVAHKVRRDLLFLLLVGAYEPFSNIQMSSILALNTETNLVDDGELLDNPSAEILTLCRPLVESASKDQVQFVHASAKEAAIEFSSNSREDADTLLARKCLSKLIQSQYRDWIYPARLLRNNLLPEDIIKQFPLPEDDLRQSYKDSVPYDYAALYWQDHVAALVKPSEEIIVKLVQFLTGNEFVTWSEVLFRLKSKSGIGAQIQVRATILAWFDKLEDTIKRRIPIKSFFVKAHESLRNEFESKGEDNILPFLPLVRLGQYFNVGGRTTGDFQKAYEYKRAVVDGYEALLGSRNPLTLRAKTEVFKEYFWQKRFDEAAEGLEGIAKIQREVIGENQLDYCFTLQLLGEAEYSVTAFEKAISTWRTAADGFRRLSGDDAFLTLQTEMFISWALERTPRLEESYDLYERTLSIWVPIGGSLHPFTLMLKTGLGSVCRKLGRFPIAQKFLLESLRGRRLLSTTPTLESPATIDSALQVAALYYAMGLAKEGIDFLDLLHDSTNLQNEFERQCQKVHIRALIDLALGYYQRAKVALQRLLDRVSGEDRENNRELLWVRITLADMLRQRGKDDEALILFMDLTSDRTRKTWPPDDGGDTSGCEPPSLVNEPQSPAQLATTERALRLVKDSKQEEADALLEANDLKWQRKKDFWVLSGGPFTDTASISGIRPSEYQPAEFTPSHGGEDLFPGITDETSNSTEDHMFTPNSGNASTNSVTTRSIEDGYILCNRHSNSSSQGSECEQEQVG